MNFSAIKKCDIANGTGVRTTLFVSGCRNHCEGCFQPETWNFNNGKEFTKETEKEIIESLSPDYIQGLTLLGGDPFEEENQEGLVTFIETVKDTYPQKDIWAYTGYLLEDLTANGKKYTEYTERMLNCIDVLVDGPFIQAEKDLRIKFRGSRNQRLIDMNEYRKTGNIMTLFGS
ncbi:MAG: anaerobic ribonucleoside-triphosphate reductase activating protein [Lachnospiraceae bacterium]|nr:anaerobic ribonucleoside-triphosphate reductase activating protein [Lachnospiraceae bacterium]